MSVQVLHGNNLEILPTLPDSSVDAVVTDPPYELGFMGKKWDASGIAYNITLWQECLRVLKPGGHLLAFGGTRTYHRMACAIEDAGFEIRDSIHWLYGSGFPKSLDVSKAIDKQAGAPVKQGKAFKVAGEYGNRDLRDPETQGVDRDAMRHEAVTDAARQWSGWGTALKPAHEPIVVARKPLVGTVASNVLTYETGALNIDASRIGTTDNIPTTSNQNIRGASYKGDNADRDRDTVYEQNPQGRWPANVLFSHYEDCQQIGVKDDVFGGGAKATSGFVNGYEHDGFVGQSVQVGVWECVAGCPVAELDRQSGIIKGQVGMKKTAGGHRFIIGDLETVQKFDHGTTDIGGASRFFYCAKPSKRERNAGLDTPSVHPTVKPLALMRYLVRLVTPPNGTVLDPFAGSGTTLMAATLEGFDAIGIEMTDEYLPIIKGRVAWAEQEAQRESEARDDQPELPL